ncbi:MAG: nucleotide exchange factor GrpE [Candidatus Micrarchaeia archaeon]
MEEGKNPNEEKSQKGKENDAESESKAAASSNVSESEYVDLKERHLRLAAEFDNYKKRAVKEFENSKTFGKIELIKRLLPVLDEFELALSIEKDEKNGGTRKGIEMIYSNLVDALKAEGLSIIDTSGSYDPYKHEIVITRESKEKEGKILEVVRKGYMLNGILVRPASVIVAKEMPQK